jgi:hypothetical protein
MEDYSVGLLRTGEKSVIILFDGCFGRQCHALSKSFDVLETGLNC